MAAAAKRRMAAVVVALLLTAASPAAAVAPPIMPAPLAADAAGTPGGSRPSGTLPAGVHLSLGDSEDSVVVMWSTAQQPDAACVQLYAADAGAQPGSATARRLQHLQAGQPGVAQPLQLPQPAPQVQTVCGSSTPFVEPSTERVSQHLSTVVLAGLAPGLRYRYRCGSDAGGWTDWRAFRAKRSAAQFSEQAPVGGWGRVGAVAGWLAGSQRAVRLLPACRPVPP